MNEQDFKRWLRGRGCVQPEEQNQETVIVVDGSSLDHDLENIYKEIMGNVQMGMLGDERR